MGLRLRSEQHRPGLWVLNWDLKKNVWLGNGIKSLLQDPGITIRTVRAAWAKRCHMSLYRVWVDSWKLAIISTSLSQKNKLKLHTWVFVLVQIQIDIKGVRLQTIQRYLRRQFTVRHICINRWNRIVCSIGIGDHLQILCNVFSWMHQAGGFYCWWF